MNLDFASFWRRFSSDWFACLLRLEAELTDPAAAEACGLADDVDAAVTAALPLVAAASLGVADLEFFELPTEGVPSELPPFLFFLFLPKRDIFILSRLDFEVFDVSEAVSSFDSSDMISDALSSLVYPPRPNFCFNFMIMYQL